ncbi:hypothetical protein ACHAWF_014525, partial [Thalassiosira exigua]
PPPPPRRRRLLAAAASSSSSAPRKTSKVGESGRVGTNDGRTPPPLASPVAVARPSSSLPSSLPPARSPHRRGRGGGGATARRSGAVVRVLAALAASALVAFAALVRRHAGLNLSNDSSSTGNEIGIGIDAPLPGRSAPRSASKRPRRDPRAAKEISKLEGELASLAEEYEGMARELEDLQKAGEEPVEPRASKAEQTEGDPAQEKKLVDQRGREEPVTRRERQRQKKLRQAAKKKEEEANAKRLKELSGANFNEAKEKGANDEALPPFPPDEGQNTYDMKHLDREPKKWWIREEVSFEREEGAEPEGNEGGAIIPVDLSVNHLQLVKRAPGSPDDDKDNDEREGPSVPEEFLPVVLPSEVHFRWRSQARVGARPEDSERTTAWRIVARRAHSEGDDDEGDEIKSDDGLVWDSGKVPSPSGLPDAVRGDAEAFDAVHPGTILQWRVSVWDSSDEGGGRPSTSSWSKFAIGPEDEEWDADWISHPIDVLARNRTDLAAFWRGNGDPSQEVACKNWERRAQLPVFRARLPPLEPPRGVEEDAAVESALLVASGLGSFRASFDGVPLSSSGPLDPPLTDFAQRVSYRGFDVTEFVTGEGARKEHVVGLSLGSGWWDHRPIAGSFIRLFYFPHGAVTCIAQLHVTYKSGKTAVFLPTGEKTSGWQVAKGHLRESSLFTGEYIDLKKMSEFKGWDAPEGWTTTTTATKANDHSWVEPMEYESDTTIESWRELLHRKSGALPMNANKKREPDHLMSPIGKLIPNEIPPVLPTERILPDEVYGLGDGRWIYDFGKAFSGMVRFEDGLPEPIVPKKYSGAHTVSTLAAKNETFVTVVYGETLELTRGDINLPLVAGMGLHDGGPWHRSKKPGDADSKGGPCYPKDHKEAGSLLQRDVYILPRNARGSQSTVGSFADARQSHFTTHAFRFAEVCCTVEPPTGVVGLAHRTAMSERGDFSSSNVRLNGGYELVKNAMADNLLGVQSDCPHREKIQYGGDIIADSPAALHFYDMSAFYRKAVRDWIGTCVVFIDSSSPFVLPPIKVFPLTCCSCMTDQQWDNGAYAGTSHWLGLNDYAAIGHGSGETVWASAPAVMTARHMQHYGDRGLLEETFPSLKRWFEFLRKHFDSGMKRKGYAEDLRGYTSAGSGLGDWLTFRIRDTWVMHQGFYMATARSLAYIGSRLGLEEDEYGAALETARSARDRMARLYSRGDGSFRPPEPGGAQMSPGPEMGLYARIVPGEGRCAALRRYFRRQGHTWPGSDESRFVREMTEPLQREMIESGEITRRGNMWAMGWSQWFGFNEGIFAVRYALRLLSDSGFHNLALSKAAGFGCGTFDYMLSHNATTHWESWWRSEDLYSHNHPMLGASAEWMVAAVAGVELSSTTVGGREVLFWPRFPNSARTVRYASATQGTRRGDFSIAWEFRGLPEEEGPSYDSATVGIHIRLFVPPDGRAVFRLPEHSDGQGADSKIRRAKLLPDIEKAKSLSSKECNERRRARMGFDHNWEYDRKNQTWARIFRKKAIGTACRSFLFHPSLDDIAWGPPESVSGTSDNGVELELGPGLYDVSVDRWQLKPEVKGARKDWRIGSMEEFYGSADIGPYCSDVDSFDWNIHDASYLI